MHLLTGQSFVTLAHLAIGDQRINAAFVQGGKIVLGVIARIGGDQSVR